MPTTADNVLFCVLDEVLAELLRKPAFTNLYGISSRPGTSAEEIAKAIGAHKGFFFHVGIFKGRNNTPAVESPLLDFTLMVICAELPKLNRSAVGTNVSCAHAALNAAAALHLYQPPSAQRCLVLDDVGPVDDDMKVVFKGEEVDLLSWYASFNVRIALKSLANVSEPAN